MPFEGFWKGKKLSAEHRLHLSESHKGYIPTKEQNEKISRALTGIKRSEKTKIKMSLVKKGKTFTEEHKEKLRQAKLGRPLSEEHRKNMSITQKNLPNNSGRFQSGHNLSCGSRNWSWRGGITPLRVKITNTFEYRQWRSDVYTRDDFTCQKCGQIGKRLNAHHKKSVGDILFLNDITTLEQALSCEELWNTNNGITYCIICHKEKHRELAILSTKSLERNK